MVAYAGRMVEGYTVISFGRHGGRCDGWRIVRECRRTSLPSICIIGRCILVICGKLSVVWEWDVALAGLEILDVLC